MAHTRGAARAAAAAVGTQPAADARDVLVAEGLDRRFDALPALDDVSLRVGPGRVLAVVGPSGCGKSTLLRAVAGLERLDRGRVVLAGRDVTGTPAHRRPVGLVFQDHALFPHLDVRDNVAFGLVEARWEPSRRRERVAELLEAFELEPLAGRGVDALSGGERQRVALARALAPKPRVLLLDEPLASLDRHLRERLALDLAGRLRGGELASVFVTHDQDEAVVVGDDLAVMRAGRIVQTGPASTVPAEPADAWIAGFFGHRNVYTGGVAARLPRGAEAGAVLLREGHVGLRVGDPPAGDASAGGASAGGATGGDERAGRGAVGARPHEVEIVRVLRDRLGLAIETSVRDLGITAWWRGAQRELGRVPAAGDRAVLLVPDDAWWPLRPTGEGES